MEEYIEQFQDKQGLIFTHENRGSYFFELGFVFQFSDIKIDIDNEIPKGLALTWCASGKQKDYSIFLIHNYYETNDT